MSAQQCHPRRRPLKANGSQVPSLSTHGMQLRKSGTFTASTNLSSDLCGLENRQYMPRRSPTSTESLEELINDPSIRRVTNLLKDFDEKLAGHKAAPKANILNDPEVLPLPSFLLDNTSLDSMDVDPKPTREVSPHDHESDSGLGSSVTSSNDGRSRRSSQPSSISSISSTHAAVTQSFSALGASEEKHTLGEYACKQIQEYIIKPILAEESLKEFHSLLKDVPRRIGEKNISNLRDLEKTLIFLAPELSISPDSYLYFCERSITLLHATVDRLSEQDQRLPTDRPYTTNYFLDLVEQIRRYAAIMAATRQKEANGEELDEMDYQPGEKVTLRGGLSHNGHPAELVREKEDGKVLPLSGREEVSGGSSLHKRALSDDEEDDDGVLRSMARRRKSDKPGDVMHVCRDCKKEFKRPCDLTKHEKTHSRPWKCTEEKCKYYDLGWPTEKERDRHVNDKHSAAPPQYKCLYPPCTYASKRESNCKQHMEKAHGWEYVRSKSNGRSKKPTTGTSGSPPTPLTPFMGTPASNPLSTPMTPFMQSPSVPVLDDFSSNNNYAFGFGTPAMSLSGFHDDQRRESVTTNNSAPYSYSSGPSPTVPAGFEDAVSPHEAMANNDVLTNLNTDFSTMSNTIVGFQQPTPAMSTGFDFDGFDFARPFPIDTTVNANNLNSAANGDLMHLSPGAHPDATLFSPQMQVDEGFGDSTANFDPPMNDFTLFDTTSANTAGNNTANFFPDLDQFGGQFTYNEPAYTEASMSTFDDLFTGFDVPQ